MVSRAITKPVSLRLPPAIWADLNAHMFRGDDNEHGAVIGSSVVETSEGFRLSGRRLFLATDGVDYLPGNQGQRMLTADFVRRCALACAEEELAYLAVHNHGGTDRVEFSPIDLESHRRGYPAVVDILDGPPAGAIVFASQAVAGDIWFSSDSQVSLDHAVIVGNSVRKLHPSPVKPTSSGAEHDRQALLFGDRGQEILGEQKIGIIGAGGAGSLINEYLARLGVGHIVSVDPDIIDVTNNPRIVGARRSDIFPWPRFSAIARLMRREPKRKVFIAERVAREAKPDIKYEAIVSDVAESSVVERLFNCDAIFLAADTMRARLVANAVCHHYLVPTWQVGAKVDSDPKTGAVLDVFSVVRHLVPGESCLWCNGLIDPGRLAEEATSPEQREAQRYVDEVTNPSVITLNAVACAHAVDQYLFRTLEIVEMPQAIRWFKYRPNDPRPVIEQPRRDEECIECQGRLGAGHLQPLPVRGDQT